MEWMRTHAQVCERFPDFPDPCSSVVSPPSRHCLLCFTFYTLNSPWKHIQILISDHWCLSFISKNLRHWPLKKTLQFDSTENITAPSINLVLSGQQHPVHSLISLTPPNQNEAGSGAQRPPLLGPRSRGKIPSHTL